MSKTHKDYAKLFKHSKHATILQGITSLLDWDQETFMPPGAAGNRAEQLKTMAGVIHKEKTGRKFASALGKLIDLKTGQLQRDDLSEAQVAALREWRRDYLHSVALPSKFVEDFAKLTSQSILAWRNAKQTSSFQQFAPYLERIIQMSRKKADFLGYSDHPYDALLDLYEPDLKTRAVDTLFAKLRDAIIPLLKKISSSAEIDDRFLFGSWETSKQIAFSHTLLKTMGYSTNYGRLDFSTHPFSSASHPTDSRITTRIHPTSLMSNISVVLHEAGHALYEMGLPPEEYGSPLGEAYSMAVHESQSRWWETRIGLSRPFWQHFLPILKDTFRGQLDQINLDVFYRAINKVESSLIRVEADEVTYPLHVILRFELEKALIDGSLSVREVPEAWNAKMQQYLGITPSNDAEGCLQDVHWAMGGFGYFPSYTLGNLYAAHLFEGFCQQHPTWEAQIAAGELSFIRDWLSTHIYQHGRRFSSAQLLQHATGVPFSADAYLQYLSNKYTHIYSSSDK